MVAQKVSITVAAELMRWAKSAARKRRTTLSAFVAEALEQQRRHQAREKYLKKALAGIPEAELDRKTAQAYGDIFGEADAAE